MPDWNAADAAVRCETAFEQTLSQRAYHFFCFPGPETLAILEQQLLSTDSDVSAIRKAALVMQAANAALAADFTQVTAALAQQGQHLACGAGCTGCCHQLVLCYPFETELIGLYMRSRPELQAFFVQTYAEWDTTTAPFREDYLLWAENFYKRGVDDKSFTVQDYFVPCPFLDNGLCRIYDVRPYACRSCVALDPECAAPQDPARKPGSNTLDFGSFTPHKKARTAAVKLLWRVLGVRADAVKSRPMAEQLRLWLNSGAAVLLQP